MGVQRSTTLGSSSRTTSIGIPPEKRKISHWHSSACALYKNGITVEASIGSSLVMMYSKCGAILLIEEGNFFLNPMIKDYAIEPERHYACMVDLLNRSGRLTLPQMLARLSSWII
ncbi:hypothetical protein HAX54_036452 [Datura stramonium]|uniref:Uncharacterized protein n=1 Tax=Datura stramonium TaxID=4076 RepID=A0ABS8VHQ8_DATST|nr:hypothetical protein [Datura stramonium]